MQPFGPFMLIDALATGGMGEVWLASPEGVHTATDELCVLKRVKSVLADDDDAVRRFVDESRLGLWLRHPCVARILDAGRVDGSDYLAVELVEGIDLRGLVERAQAARRPLDSDLAMWCLVGTLDGLAYAHAARHPISGDPLGVVHRDISPHNLMAARDGVVRVIDFGLALSTVREARTEQGVVMGKLAYMSPEQARGEPVDDRCDVFSAGVVLYELIAGERYWGGLPQNEIWQLVGRGSFRARRAAEVDAATGGIFSLLVAPHASQRPSAAEARDALLALLDAGPGTDELGRRLGQLVSLMAAPELARVDKARDAARSRAPTIGELPRTTISVALAEVRAVEALLKLPPPPVARHAPSTVRPLPRLMMQASTALMARATPTLIAEPEPSLPSTPQRPVVAPVVRLVSSTAPQIEAEPIRPVRRIAGIVAFAMMASALVIGVLLGLRHSSPHLSPPAVVLASPVASRPSPVLPVVAPPVPVSAPSPSSVMPSVSSVPAPPPHASADDKLLRRMRALGSCTLSCARSFKEPARRGLAGLSPSLRAQLPTLVTNCEKLCHR